jgi:transcriptional regulator with XRE-family HTH domain
VELTPEQLRAARFLLNWTIRDLAEASLVGARTITRFERGKAMLRQRTQLDLTRALNAAGVTIELGEPGEALIKLHDGSVVKKVADRG